jgi:hypothetical protein
MKTKRRFLRRWRWPLIVAAVCAVLAVPLMSMTMAHCWLVDRGANVTVEGKTVGASVYASSYGKYVLVYLDEDQPLYLIDLATQQISLPNRSAFLILPGVVVSHHFPPLGAPMGKAEIDPQLVIGNQSVEFTSIDRSRIRVNVSG